MIDRERGSARLTQSAHKTKGLDMPSSAYQQTRSRREIRGTSDSDMQQLVDKILDDRPGPPISASPALSEVVRGIGLFTALRRAGVAPKERESSNN